MAFAAGARLGPYEIVSALGAGGMGEVYRARDTRLDRDVALKMLPDAFARDRDRVARFRREAQLLAALNHPHIAAIYGLEESGDTQFLVLELVDGETLAERAKRGPMPIDEAVAIARQIVDALEAAHDKGIVHRDLKPANIALTASDQVKVLDFGLARAPDTGVSSDISRSPTLTFHGTQAGVILGTAAYMSPEQAKGRAADKRSDIWAFGCVFYEMLAGRRAFEGDDVSETLAAVLRGEPDWSALPPTVPASVRTLIQRCLVKDRHARVADAGVVRYVLDERLTAPDTIEMSPATPAPARSPGLLALGGVVVALAGGALAWMVKPQTPAPAKPLTRFPIVLGSDQVLTGTSRHVLALSADGTRLVFGANGQLYLRAMDQLDVAPIRGTGETPMEPIFSPDGQSVAYYSAGHWKRIPLGGGAPTTLCDAAAPWGASWDSNRIVFGEGSQGIFEVPATGGTPKQIVAAVPKQGETLHGPQILPGGQTILFTVGTVRAIVDRWASAQIVAQSLKTGERKVIVQGGTDGRYLPTGHLVYVRDGTLFANAFDVNTLELKGGPTAMLEGLSQALGASTGAAHFAISASGSLVYPPLTVGQGATLAWRNRQGVDTPMAAPARWYDTPRVSPDGTRIAVHASDQENDIWIWDTRGETLTRLTFDKAADSSPLWTKDGKRIIYVSARDGAPNLYWKPADGTGQPEPLLKQPPVSNGALVANSLSADGKQLVYSVGVPSDVMAVSFDGDRRPRPLIAQPQFAERGGDVSPDGRWIVYYSDESGTFQIYVRPFPAVDSGRWQVSGEGGTLPRWAPNGRELFYIDAHYHLVTVSVRPGATFSSGKPTTLFDLGDTLVSAYRNYDVAPDGLRFVVTKVPRTRGAPQFTVVENWFEELKARVPTK